MAHQFRQTATTTIGSQQAIDEFGSFDETDQVDSISKNEYQPRANTDPFIFQLARTFKRPSSIPEWTQEISRKEFQQVWKKCREKTTSSPHNVHFGHFKAIAIDNWLSTFFPRLI
mmetsp:Transcript_5090/g.7787  ORF Transcript_5090/g.7787 Transcript_5090/m.7787 type:complete len:115 (-) Transcript_5090:1392-1736(-)